MNYLPYLKERKAFVVCKNLGRIVGPPFGNNMNEQGIQKKSRYFLATFARYKCYKTSCNLEGDCYKKIAQVLHNFSQ